MGQVIKCCLPSPDPAEQDGQASPSGQRVLSTGFDMKLEENQQRFAALQERYSKIVFKPKEQLKVFKRKEPFPVAKKSIVWSCLPGSNPGEKVR